jgi:hypothetical protein
MGKTGKAVCVERSTRKSERVKIICNRVCIIRSDQIRFDSIRFDSIRLE